MWEGPLVGVGRLFEGYGLGCLSGGYLEGVGSLEGVGKLSGVCGEAVWRVWGGCLVG